MSALSQTNPPWTLAEFAAFRYEGSWLYAPRAEARGDSDYLERLERVNESDAENFHQIADEIRRIGVKEDPDLFEREMRFLHRIAEALRRVVPAVERGELEQLPDPADFRREAKAISDAGGVLEYRGRVPTDGSRPSLSTLSGVA